MAGKKCIIIAGTGTNSQLSVSRFTYFIISHGARVFCKFVEVNHGRSPLIQGGLEITIEVTVEMDDSEQNILTSYCEVQEPSRRAL